jgi:hypothetical protein
VVKEKWEFIFQHFNERHTLKFGRNIRTSVDFKTKFWELVHGTSTSSGERDEFGQRAKDIAGIIDKEIGIISSENDTLPSKEMNVLLMKRKRNHQKNEHKWDLKIQLLIIWWNFKRLNNDNERIELNLFQSKI